MQTDWAQLFQYSFQTVWVEVVSFLPQLVVGILILILGWIIGAILKQVVAKIFQTLNVDKGLDAAGVDTLVNRAGYKLNSGAFVGSLVKWFVIIVFFVVALDAMSLDQAVAFFNDVVLGYLPKVIAAVIILFGGLILASFVEKVVEAGARTAAFKNTQLLGAFARYAIIVFTVLAALTQLEIAPALIQTLFAGLVFALSLALGLAFGLGGREQAARYLENSMGGQSGGPRGPHA